MAPTPPGSQARYDAFKRVVRKLPLAQRQQLINDIMSNGANVPNDLQMLNASDRATVNAFLSDQNAVALFLAELLKGPIAGFGNAIAPGTGFVGGLPQGVGGAVGQGLVNAADPIAGIAGILSALTQRSTWLRVGEGLLGLILIGVGLAAITRSTSTGKAIQSGVVKAAKVIK